MSNKRRITVNTSSIEQFIENVIGSDLLKYKSSFPNGSSATSYPPYNIIQHDDGVWIIEMAVAGFDEDEISVSAYNQILTVTGRSLTHGDEPENYIHRGISSKDFERSYKLGSNVEVGNVTLTSGILRVYLKEHEPIKDTPTEYKINVGGN